MPQLNYSYQPPIGVPGSLYDLSPYAINSRSNGETAPGALKYGMGVVLGDTPGKNVNLPTDASTLAEFEGVAMTGFTDQMDMAGEVIILPQRTVGVLRWGRAWVRIEEGVVDIAYGDPVYLVIDGADAGLFTNDDGGGDNLAINAMFIGGLGTTSVAPVELYNQKNEAAATP